MDTLLICGAMMYIVECGTVMLKHIESDGLTKELLLIPFMPFIVPLMVVGYGLYNLGNHCFILEQMKVMKLIDNVINK